MLDDILISMTADEIRINHSRLSDLVRMSHNIEELKLKLAFEKAMVELDPRRTKNMIRIHQAQLDLCYETYQSIVKNIKTQ
jgi:hypothetical protein